MKSLVIIDMQGRYLEWQSFYAISKRKYDSNRSRAIVRICNTIEGYKMSGEPIIVVKFFGYKRDHESSNALDEDIFNVIGNYGNLFYAWKIDCDGSKQIMQSIKDIVNPDVFEICGCYTTACVQETVHGLSKLVNPSVKIRVLYNHTFDTIIGDKEHFSKQFNKQVEVV